MAASNQLTIQITGDESDLKKALEKAAKDIQDTSNQIKKSGKDAGTNFGTGFSDGARGKLRLVTEGFKEIETTAASGFGGIAQSFLTLAVNPITLGVAAIGASVIAAFQFAKIGEENKKIGETFSRFANDAGLDAERLKEKISDVADGFVDLEDVLPRAGQAVLALGKNAERIPEILALARNIGVQTGRDVKEVFDELTKGIENQNVKLLRNNSIRLDSDKVLQDYAKSQGVLVTQLSEAARQQAFLNATLEQGSKKFGEVGAQAAPIQGGIKKLELAFDDLKDAIAAVVNSNLGVFFAEVINDAASATKAVAEFFTPKKEGPATIADQIKEVKATIDQISESKLSNPAFAEGYNRQLDEANAKLAALQTVQNAIDQANTQRAQLTKEEVVAGETDAQITARVEKEMQAQAELAAIKAEGRAIEQQAELDHQIALTAIENDGDMNSQAVKDMAFQAQIQRNAMEYESALAKAQKIKDIGQREAAEDVARQKLVAANRKAVDAQGVIDAKAAADAKLAIENNLFKAATMLADQQSALGKTLAVAQAVRQTYLAATAALAPPPVDAGPLFGPALAASTIALGIAQVAKITAANTGALVTGGQPGQDTNPFLLSKGEIVAPAKSFDEVVEGTARQRGFVKGGESGQTDALLRELIDKIDTKSVSITVNTDVVADDNGINTLVQRIRDAIDFNAAPTLG